jgi:hypothetical protein
MPVSTRGTPRKATPSKRNLLSSIPINKTDSGTPKSILRTNSSSKSGENSTEETDISEALFSSPTRKRLKPLPVAVEKQLLKDILRAGGLELVVLKEICDEKPDIYGYPASTVRRQVQNKFDKWKRTEPELDQPALCDIINSLNRKEKVKKKTPQQKKASVVQEPTIAAQQLPALRSPEEVKTTSVAFEVIRRNSTERRIPDDSSTMGDSTADLFQKLFGSDQEDFESRVSKFSCSIFTYFISFLFLSICTF